MSIRDLKRLLDQVPDHGELVLRRSGAWSASYDAWVDAREETWVAYHAWREAPTAASYAVYRAAQDREDAAQDTLARATSAAPDQRPARAA